MRAGETADLAVSDIAISELLILKLIFMFQLYFFLRREQFLQWIENLPVHQTPSWLGLPNNAEVVLLTTKGSSLTAKLLKMQSLSDDDDFLSSVGTTIT